MMIRVGIGYDVHRVTKDRDLVLGCVRIEHTGVGLEGHSDADVVAHAVCDALLGAAALGDIGEHFPDTDARYRGYPGRDFLARVSAMVLEAGFTIVNVDCVVMCDVVTLGARKQAMAASVASALGVDAGRVGVKATTFEGRGAVGRGEVIACEAVACIENAGDLP
jgi:2-C-methyl-D-erythritol 2,4-cyclodiphosphate synthase